MTTVTATEARRRLYSLLEDVADTHEPIQIAGKRHSAVLVSEARLDGHPGDRSSSKPSPR